MNLKEKVQEVMENFCDNTFMFTSLDVSNTVKQNGFPGARHREVAEIVREQYKIGMLDEWNYTRTLVDVNILGGLKTKAYVYYYRTSDPNSYTNKNKVTIVPTQHGTNKQDTPITQDIQNILFTNMYDRTNNSNQEKKKNKSDGRLEIPAVWVKKLEWQAGDYIYILKRDPCVLVLCVAGSIEKVASVDDDIIAITKITPDGRLRVPKTAFVCADMPYNTDYLIKIEEDSIVVRNDS